MDVLLIVVGAVVVAVTAGDLLSTTVSVASVNGLVSGHITDRLWRLLLRRSLSHRALRLAGPTIVSGLIVSWAVLLWAGWSLVFIGAGDAIVESSGGAPATPGQRVYYAGYLVATLGNGDLVAATTGWRVLSVLASLNGLLAMTLAITFLVPVVSGVVQRRSLAAQLAGLGGTPEAVLRRSWNGTDFSALEPYLVGIVPELHQLTQRHLAYPVLHYFHSDQRDAAIAPMVAVLDESLLVLHAGVADHGISNLTLRSCRDATTELLRLLTDSFVEPSDVAPAAPDLASPSALGAAVCDPADFARAVERSSPRRRRLRGLVESDGWQWDDVLGADRARDADDLRMHPVDG